MEINLLPWREELRKQREQKFYIGLGATVSAALLVLGLVYIEIDALISYQQSRNQYLEAEIKRVDKAIAEIQDLQKKKKALLERMGVIKKFQSDRSDSVRLLDEIVKILPDGVHLTSYQQTKTKQDFSGVAQSNARVSAFMRNIERSKWVKKPDLKVIKAEVVERNKRYRYSSFSLTAEQVVSDVSEKK